MPGQVEGERGPDGRKLSSKRLSKRGKPGNEEAPKSDTAKDEPAGAEPGQVDNPQSQTATEQGKAAEIKPATEVKPTESPMSEPKSEAKTEAKSEPDSDLKPEPKAGQSNSGEGKSETAPTVAAAVSNGSPEPVTGSSTPASQAAPALVVTAPPPPPVTPAGPPAPPISQ